jgi:hypothetical protein
MTIIAPQNVFRKFKEVFKTSGLSAENWDDNRLWTKKMIGCGKTRDKGDYGIFGEIAKKYGFFPEEPRGKYETLYHVERGWLTADQLWSVVREHRIWELEVAIEHENNPSWDAVRYDLAKLADIKARLKILVAYPNRQELQKLLDGVSEILRKKPIKNKEEKYLVIFGWVKLNRIKFKAWAFDYQGKRIRVGEFVR